MQIQFLYHNSTEESNSYFKYKTEIIHYESQNKINKYVYNDLIG